MNHFINEYIKNVELPETVILVPSPQEAITGVTFFDYANKLEILENRFLAYIVAIKNRRFLLVEAGKGDFSLLERLQEMMKNKVKKYLFLNRAFSLKKKIPAEDIIVVKESGLLSGKTTVSPDKDLIKLFKPDDRIQQGKNVSLDINYLFFKRSPRKSPPGFKNFDIASVGDHAFLKYLKENKLSGISIDYVVGEFPDKMGDEDIAFRNAMSYLIEHFLMKI
ncbi:MAG: hypothetical protein KKH98_00505 [Spirochaetes bacterium]|nr:hypothetical protein [Spirochaetota bacterium]